MPNCVERINIDAKLSYNHIQFYENFSPQLAHCGIAANLLSSTLQESSPKPKGTHVIKLSTGDRVIGRLLV